MAPAKAPSEVAFVLGGGGVLGAGGRIDNWLEAQGEEAVAQAR